ncbi:MAG: efflux transporter outer membrane subunit [Pseudomonadota bacterium]
MLKKSSYFILFSAVLAITACSNYGESDAPFKNVPFFSDFENQNDSEQNLSEFIENTQQWWIHYNDDQAEAYIYELLSQNLQLKAASARLLQAKEQTNIARGALLPNLSSDGSFSRNSIPPNSNNNGFSSGQRFYNTSYDLGLSASWQLDFFGQLRNQLASAQASFLASEAAKDALTHSLIVELLNARIATASLYKQKELIERTIRSREKTLEIINRRYELGVSGNSALEVRLARENLSAAKAQLPSILSAIQENTYRLDVLRGQMPNTEDGDERYEDLSLPLPPERLILPPPLALLDTRPDLRNAELVLIAAKRDVKVAMADLYPSIGISGNYGFQAAELGDLISSDSIAWSLLSNITQPLFEGGRIRSNIRLSKARAEELSADYAQNVLTAIEDVENALQREENFRNQYDALQDTLLESEKAYALARTRYEKGLIGLTDLLDIERRVLSLEQQLIDTQLSVWQSRFALHLALGGSWLDEMSTPQDEIKEKDISEQKAFQDVRNNETIEVTISE